MASPVNEVYLNHLSAALGSRVERNDADTLGLPAAECERIVAKIGIAQRPVVGEGEYTSDLAVRAGARLLQETALDATAIDTLLVCTQTPDHLIPGVSSQVHAQLGLSSGCFATDINQGCSGFIYALQMLGAMLRAGSSQQALLIHADSYSRLIRPADWSTRVLFGDAACAVGLSTRPHGWRLLHTRCYSDGRGYQDFVARHSALRRDDADLPGIQMQGPAILNFALRVVPEAITRAMEETGLQLAQLHTVAFHQANRFIIDQLRRKLGLREEQVPTNGAELGNTVSASIPLLLQQREAQLSPGDKVLAVGFGVGLSWGTALLEYVGPAR